MKKPIALVTGGSRGLGRNAVLKLADKGVDVIFTYNTQTQAATELINEVKTKGCKAVAIQLDISDISSFPIFCHMVKQSLENIWQCEKFDFLINNAGVGGEALFCDTTEALFDQLMNIHFKGPFFLTQNLLGLLNDGGRILNVSTALTREPLVGYAAYSAMKGAMEVITRYLAKELGSRKITVNTIAPGAVETDFGGGVVRDNQDINNFIATQTVLGRAGHPDDIGNAIVAMVSDEMSWMTAQCVVVSGGMFL